MNSVKKIFGVIFMLACLILPQNVSAEKKDWQDKSYNFHGIRRVVLMDVAGNANLGGSNIARQKIHSTYLDNAQKRLKAQIYTEAQARQMTAAQNFSDIADLYIACKINDWSDDYYIVPERTVWEKKTMHRKVRDRYGYWVDESYETTVPVTYPPYRVDVSKIAVAFEVYDTHTGALIFGREDIRDRNDANAQDAMFGRICNSFFQDFAKIIK